MSSATFARRRSGPSGLGASGVLVRKLHLVGLTTDREGLIFSGRKGSKSGGFVVPLGDELLAAIADVQRSRNGDEIPQPAAGAAASAETAGGRAESSLTPREIQARLRAGKTIAEVAAEAGVGVEWVERFAVPILAEQAKVVELALTLTYSKPRLGESSQPLRESMAWNLADRGIYLPEDRFEAGWSAHHLHDSVWVVRFRYHSRQRLHEAAWELDVPAARLTARDRLASELGYIDKNRRRPITRAADHEEPDENGEGPVPRPRTVRPAKSRPVRRTSSRRAAPKVPASRKATSSSGGRASKAAGSRAAGSRAAKAAVARTASKRVAGGSAPSKRAPSRAAGTKAAGTKAAGTKAAGTKASATTRVASRTRPAPASSRTTRRVGTTTAGRAPAGRPAGRRTAAARPKRESPSPSGRPRAAGNGTAGVGRELATPGVALDAVVGEDGRAGEPVTGAAGVRQAVARVTSDRLAATRAATRWESATSAKGGSSRRAPRAEVRPVPTHSRPDGVGRRPPPKAPEQGSGPDEPVGTSRAPRSEDMTHSNGDVGSTGVDSEPVDSATAPEPSSPEPSSPAESSPERPEPLVRRLPAGDEASGQFRPQPAPAWDDEDTDPGPPLEPHRRATITAGRVVGDSFPPPHAREAAAPGVPPRPLDDPPRRRLRLGRRRDG